MEYPLLPVHRTPKMETLQPITTESIHIEQQHDRLSLQQQHTVATPQVPTSSSMAYQHKHALHRLRRLKKRSPHRDLVISFVPRLRTSIINRLDFFNRYSKQEQEVLSCFDFLDELVLAYCDGSLDSPSDEHTMIYEFIQS